MAVSVCLRDYRDRLLGNLTQVLECKTNTEDPSKAKHENEMVILKPRASQEMCRLNREKERTRKWHGRMEGGTTETSPCFPVISFLDSVKSKTITSRE